MRKIILSLMFILVMAAHCYAGQATIGTGDWVDIRGDINDNFDEVYTSIGSSVQEGDNVASGVEDTTAGGLILYGGSGTSNSAFWMHNAADEDGTVNAWGWTTSGTDFHLGITGTPELFVFSSDGSLTLTGGVIVPQSATAQSIGIWAASADGAYKTTITSDTLTAHRAGTFPNYDSAFLASGNVDAVGDLADGSVDLVHMSTDSVNYTKTTGSFKALDPVTDDADDFATAFTGVNLYGGTFVANLAGDIDLPSPVSGMNFTVITFGDIEVDALPDTGDDLILDGVQLDANHDASNTGSEGDIAVFQYYDSTGWLVTSNGWTEVAD